MQGAAAQAMSVHIVEPPQRRPRPTYAASGGNGGWARRPPGLAAAAPEARYRGPGSAATRTGAWVLRAIAALLVVDDAQDIAFLLLGARADCSCQLPGREFAPCARIAIPMRATPCTCATGS